jgi:hypothetical protein
MGESETGSGKSTSFARVRVPLVLVTLAILSFGAYYLFFVERETTYFSNRNARLIVGLAAQLRDSIDATSEYVNQAALLPRNEVPAIFKYAPAARSPMPAAVFTKIETSANEEDPKAKLDRPHRFAERTASGFVLHFNHLVTLVTSAPSPKEGTSAGLANTAVKGNATGATPNSSSPAGTSLVTSSVDLSRLADQIVQQSSAAVFASVFILDSTGAVVYQRRGETEKSGSVKIVQIHELPQRRYFGKDEVVSIADLLAASRNTSVHIGDAEYQLFSAPLRSGFDTVDGSPANDTWVLCGIVRESEFRTQALAISVTLISTAAAALLLLIFSWPFLKVALISATHRLSTVDVVLLGLCGILASSILSLTVLDWLAYSNLEARADEQLKALATGMDANFRKERRLISDQLGTALVWAENQFTDNKQHPAITEVAGEEPIDVTPLEPRNGDLLKDNSLSYPYIQSFALISANGWQGVKWFVDKRERVTPIVRVSNRTYFTAARDKTNDYLDLGPEGGGKLAMQSVRSITTGLPEIDFGRRTDELPGNETYGQKRVRTNFPVITMTVPDALSVGHPVFPRYFTFAIIDASGSVLFHSEDRRNTVENFFDETDRDRRLRAAVSARRDEVMNIRYWGDDYRAFVHPMPGLPWTVITLREKSGLRTLNTEALILTMVSILILVGPGLMLFIALVKLTRPRYSARWLWPDPARVPDYADLAVIYGVLLAAAIGLLARLPSGALLFLPYWFVPIVLVVTYVRIAKPRSWPKRFAMFAAMISCLIVGILSIGFETRRLPAGNGAIETESLLMAGLIALSIVYVAWRAGQNVAAQTPKTLSECTSVTSPGTAATEGATQVSDAIAVLREDSAQLIRVGAESDATATQPDDGRDTANLEAWREIRIKQQAHLPLAYCGVAFLLLLLTSVVPTTAFFQAAYRVELVSFVKSVQVQLVRDLQARWWRASAQYNEARSDWKIGALQKLLQKRWSESLDLYNRAAFSTEIGFNPPVKQPQSSSTETSVFPHFIENVLPHYSEASVNTRELIHDRSSDAQWWWTFPTTSAITLWLKPPESVLPANAATGTATVKAEKARAKGNRERPDLFVNITSAVPSNLIELGSIDQGSGDGSVGTLISLVLRLATVAILLVANFWIAQFIARRVFLVDLVNPRWLTQGVLGLRHVICYPYDESRLMPTDKKRHAGQSDLLADYESIDLREPADCKRAEGLPQGFRAQPFEQYVLIKGLDYRFATGEKAVMLRGLLERLMRNADRNIVLLPKTMSVITNALLQGGEADEWSKVLSSFVWVSGAQLASETARPSTTSGHFSAVFGSKRVKHVRTRWQRMIRMFSGVFGFASYIEQIVDGRPSAERAFKDEIRHDAYLASLVQGLDSEATARDQVLEEISERAENYYTSLWHTCTHLEKIVLLQLAQTGLVNEKMRRDVRRLLARGLIRRDPRMRVMNETFRRFVLSHAVNTELANELEPGFGTDAWHRFRVPLFATVLVVTLFFFVTQHELFDATIASVTGVAAALPAFAKILTVWGERAAKNVR